MPMQQKISAAWRLAWLLALFPLAGCEGGKNRQTDCSGSAPYVQCDSAAPKPCPAGQQRVDGVCKVPDPQCPAGSRPVAGRCVEDGADCGAGQHREGDQCVADQLQLEILNQSLCRTRNGATRIILQFITRDEAGLALDPEVDAAGEATALSPQLFVNSRPADVESLLSGDSELLKSNLAISLVLDATYSMLQHNPPAFEPMKAAAVDVLQELQQLWTANAAEFHWELTWFDDRIFRPQPNNRGAPWSISDIASIPTPKQGQFTGLWKAVHYGIGVHETLRGQGVAAGPRDQHVMVVFSDGDDNHSFFDNRDASFSGTGNLDSMLFWNYAGYAPTTIDHIKTRLETNPELRVYIIGFGDNIGEEGRSHLQEIAQQSRGQYFHGSGGDNLGLLFDSVKREFITMQTLGVETPLDPALAHSFSLRNQHLASGAQGSFDFALIANQTLDTCTE